MNVAALIIALVYGGLARQAVSMPIEMFVLMGAAVKGVVAGLLYGQAQGRVLDRVVADRGSWTRVVMVGFMLGALLGSMRWLVGPAAMDPASLVIGGLVWRGAGGVGARPGERRRLPLHAASRRSASAALRFSRAGAS